MAKWIEDPQGRLEVEKVTEEIKLPVWKANYKGKFREFWNECWDKIENSFLKLKKSIDGKEAVITKKSGFNLEKTDSFEEDDTNKLATAKALKSLHDEVDRKTGAIKLNWDSIKDKPSSFVPSEHNHNSLYYTETEVDEKLENNILYSTGKTYGGLLNEPGAKSAGKAYWDNNTKKLYICKNNNSDISPNINNYIPFDNGSILERLENLSISAGTEILVKNFSNKSNFTVQEIIWTEEEYRKAIKNYDFISLYFSSSYISIQGPLLTKTTRPYVSIPSANGNTFYLFLAEDRDFITVMNTVNFSPIRCNELKIYGFKIR